MESYTYGGSYPESGESSPRSREVEFENSAAWEEKVKLMCSYGGKIQPRPHDNQLSYLGGHTKILSLDRSLTLSSLLSKLSSLSSLPHISFKYQLPGEDLDALISVTNDDDLDHMLHEYDRLFRATAKHARLRLFLFSSLDAVSDQQPNNNVDFLFGLDKGMAPPPKVQDTVMPPLGFLHDQMQRMQIGGEQGMYRRKSDDTGYAPPADYYAPKLPEKIQPPSPVHLASPAPPPVSGPPGFWAEKQLEQQPMYMVQTQGGVYHAPVMGQSGQGYYMQRMGHDVYREQPVYNMAPPQMPPKVTAYSEGYAGVRPSVAGETGGYVAYDNTTGRQVYYNAPGGVVAMQQPQYHQDGKMVTSKVSQP